MQLCSNGNSVIIQGHGPWANIPSTISKFTLNGTAVIWLSLNYLVVTSERRIVFDKNKVIASRAVCIWSPRNILICETRYMA